MTSGHSTSLGKRTKVARDWQVPVLIVGGGPVGLALALELSHQGIRSTVVETAPFTASELLAKAGTLNERSLEFCRRWGIADQVANWGADPTYPRDTCFVTSLNGYLIGRDKVASARERKAEHSPEMLRKCPQHIFDPLLARTVQARGATDLRYGTVFEALEQDEAGVTARLRPQDGGSPFTLRAGYVVACDGAASGVRKQLGIPFEGPTLDYSISAMLRVHRLEDYHPFGRATRFLFVGRDGTWANLTSVDYGDLWRFTLLGSEERLSGSEIDMPARLRAAIGRDDVPFEMLRALPWRRSQSVAGSYRRGRVLLAGDAAHTTSPTGGHGLNTGLGDVVGLGWMLAACVQGWGEERLLDAYTDERRPVAIRNGEASTRNYAGWMAGGDDLTRVLDQGDPGNAARQRIAAQMSAMLAPEWNSAGIRLGYRYEASPIIVADGTPEPPDPEQTYEPTARPGHRAPHAWLAPGRSTIDLYGRGFVLLKLGAQSPDVQPLVDAAASRGVPLVCHAIDDPAIAALHGRALVLVRPDGHVAWRSDNLPSNPLELVDVVRGAGPARGSPGDAPRPRELQEEHR